VVEADVTGIIMVEVVSGEVKDIIQVEVLGEDKDIMEDSVAVTDLVDLGEDINQDSTKGEDINQDSIKGDLVVVGNLRLVPLPQQAMEEDLEVHPHPVQQQPPQAQVVAYSVVALPLPLLQQLHRANKT